MSHLPLRGVILARETVVHFREFRITNDDCALCVPLDLS
jgi:hypothetical protein